MTNARIGQALIESASTGTPNVRIGQALIESVTTGSPNVRFGQALVESVTTGSPNARIGQMLVEYVVTMQVDAMIPTIVFPALNVANGIGWSVHRRPTFSTRVQIAVSGREVRSPLFAYPLYEFELTFDALLSGPNGLGAIGPETLQELQGFFLQLQGQYGAFLFTDPDFNQVAGGVLGTGTGTATAFALQRTVGAYSEAVQAANVVTAVYLNGVAQVGGSWAVSNGNQILFAAAPPAGAVVTADFSYYFVVRFLEDVHDYEEFMYQIHTLKSCKMRTVRTS